MTTRKDGAVLRQLNTLFNVGAIRELSDGQLLERFLTGRGEVAELAFEALVERHGAMVLRVCRAELVDPHDTQDAFQATFLILVEKARTLWVRDSLGPWLHQVAFRTASCARSAATRRRRHERRAAEVSASFDEHEDRASSELEKALHDEINRLPECYRVPIVLCELEGYTCEEAARRMGRPVGTVKSWRFRGRERLRHRLIRLGLAPAAGLEAVLAMDAARAAVPQESVRVAVRALSDWTTAGEVSASVQTLIKGVLKTMLFGKLRMTATAAFALVFLTAGLGAAAWVLAQDSNHAIDAAQSAAIRPAFVEQSRRISSSVQDHDEVWSLSLREAIRIGLENSEAIQVIASGGNGTPCKIAPLTGNNDAHQFKAKVMADVRSIEQMYWNLALANVQLWASDRAVALAKEIVKHEEAQRKLGNRDAVLAEASKRLEQFNLDLVTRTSDVITTDRQLRKLLRLPAVDGRRIVPVTAPTEARLEPNWEECLATMLEKQPDVVRAKALVTKAERDGDLAQLERTQSMLRTVIDQTTQSLTRFFKEIDANYKQFQTASRLRASAEKRLQSQQGYYAEGRITVDRFLDAASQYATAVATQAQYKTSYNISIVALEEAKGTLLEHEQITVVEGPRLADFTFAARDAATKRPSREPSALTLTAPPTVAPVAQPSQQGALGGKTFSFQVTIGLGSKPVEIRGSFTITPVQPVDAPR